MSISAVHGIVLLAVLVVMVHASVCDLRRREVPDADWAIVFCLGALLFLTGGTGMPPAAGAFAALSVALMAADLVWDRDPTAGRDALLYAGIILSVLAAVFLSRGTSACLSYASVPAMYILMNVLYYTGIVRGGADAKAVIALASVMPAYVADGMPATDAVYLFPPALAILLVSAIIAAGLVLVYLAVNAVRHDLRFPMALMGYRMDIGDAEKSFVWPMTYVQAGALIDGSRADDSEDAYRKLREAGAERIWVTPIIPFIVPITIAYCIVLLWGNPLFLIIG